MRIGLSALQASLDASATEPEHIVLIVEREAISLFVSGLPSASRSTSAGVDNFEAWEPGHILALANELVCPRAWLGTYHRVAVYCDALSEAHVRALFEAGPEDCACAFAPRLAPILVHRHLGAFHARPTLPPTPRSPARPGHADAGRAGPASAAARGRRRPPLGNMAKRFDFGGGGAFAYEGRVVPRLGLDVRAAFALFPPSEGERAAEGMGTFFALTAGPRFHPLPRLRQGDLWIALSLDFVLTGDQLRAGFGFGIGFDAELGDALRVGPFFRWDHILQPDGHRLGREDASFAIFGLSVSLLGEPRPPEPPDDADGDALDDAADRCPHAPEDRDGYRDEDGCPDGDNDDDGIPDAIDACPLEAASGDGCPASTRAPAPRLRGGS